MVGTRDSRLSGPGPGPGPRWSLVRRRNYGLGNNLTNAKGRRPFFMKPYSLKLKSEVKFKDFYEVFNE